MKRRKTLIRVAVAIACWYALVFLGRGCVSPQPVRWRAIQTVTLAEAKRIARKSFSQQELANAVGSLKLKRSMTTFHPEVTYQNETNWAVRLKPSPATPYNLPVWWRVVFLDFTRAQFKTITVGANEDAQQSPAGDALKAAPEE